MIPPWYDAPALGELVGTAGQLREAARQIPASKREGVLIAFRRALAQIPPALAPLAEVVGPALDGERRALWWLALASQAPALVPLDLRLAVAALGSPAWREAQEGARRAGLRAEEVAAGAWVAALGALDAGTGTPEALVVGRLLAEPWRSSSRGLRGAA